MVGRQLEILSSFVIEDGGGNQCCLSPKRRQTKCFPTHSHSMIRYRCDITGLSEEFPVRPDKFRQIKLVYPKMMVYLNAG